MLAWVSRKLPVDVLGRVMCSYGGYTSVTVCNSGLTGWNGGYTPVVFNGAPLKGGHLKQMRATISAISEQTLAIG